VNQVEHQDQGVDEVEIPDIEPGHVMAREQYERLAAEAKAQKQ
jgi:hypothetical protein